MSSKLSRSVSSFHRSIRRGSTFGVRGRGYPCIATISADSMMSLCDFGRPRSHRAIASKRKLNDEFPPNSGNLRLVRRLSRIAPATSGKKKINFADRFETPKNKFEKTSTKNKLLFGSKRCFRRIPELFLGGHSANDSAWSRFREDRATQKVAETKTRGKLDR